MRIALIGGTRFIGPAIARRLLARGHSVHVLHRGVHPSPVPAATSVTVDRSDRTALRAALSADGGFDAVIDTRAMNRQQAETTRDALGDRATRLVVLSSQDIYAQFQALLGLPSGAAEPEITETSPLGAYHPYADIRGAHDEDEGYGKRAVEEVFLDAPAVPTTALRLPPTFGPGDPARRFGGIFDALSAGPATLPRAGGGRWRWTHGHVDNVAQAVALSVEDGRPTSTVFNVGDARTPTMSAWAETIAAQLGVTFDWREVADADLPESLAHLGERAPDIVVSTAKIREELGFTEIVPPQEALADHLRGLAARPR